MLQSVELVSWKKECGQWLKDTHTHFQLTNSGTYNVHQQRQYINIIPYSQNHNYSNKILMKHKKKNLLIQGLYAVEAPYICKQTLNTFLDPKLT